MSLVSSRPVNLKIGIFYDQKFCQFDNTHNDIPFVFSHLIHIVMWLSSTSHSLCWILCTRTLQIITEKTGEFWSNCKTVPGVISFDWLCEDVTNIPWVVYRADIVTSNILISIWHKYHLCQVTLLRDKWSPYQLGLSRVVMRVTETSVIGYKQISDSPPFPPPLRVLADNLLITFYASSVPVLGNWKQPEIDSVRSNRELMNAL